MAAFERPTPPAALMPSPVLLSDYLATSGPLPAEAVTSVADPLAEELDRAASSGALHLALTPRRVRLCPNVDEVRVELLDGPTLPSPSDGTRPDLRGLGVVLWSLLTGDGAADDVASVHPDALPQAVRFVAPVLRRCLRVDDAPPFGSATEAVRVLRALVLRAGAPAPLLLVPDQAHEKVGDMLGSYSLERLVGEGSTSRVFLARHAQLGRSAALKVLRPEHARNPQVRARFLREGRAVNRVRHPHVVQVLDFVEDTGPTGLPRAYLVMEWLEGESLLDRSRRLPPTTQEAVRWVGQACLGLAAAHAAGVVHRDVKPENLWLTLQGEVKVLDFGAAKLTGNTELAWVRSTLEGTVVGTPLYLAPEQMAGRASSGLSDLYAAATVLYELLAGYPPFQAQQFDELAERVLNDSPPPLPLYTLSGERIPDGLRQCVMQALSKNPGDRPASMARLAETLSRFEGERREPRVSASDLRRSARTVAAMAVVAAVTWMVARSPGERGTDLVAAPSAPSAAEQRFAVAARSAELEAQLAVQKRVTTPRPVAAPAPLKPARSKASAKRARLRPPSTAAVAATEPPARHPEAWVPAAPQVPRPKIRSLALETPGGRERKPVVARAPGPRPSRRMNRDAVLDPFAR